MPLCFYQFTREVSKNASLLKSINVTISGNSAPSGGENLFGGSIDYCNLLCVKESNKKFKRHLNIPSNAITSSSISSTPQQVCFYDDELNCRNKVKVVLVYPGQSVTQKFQVVGQLNGAIAGTVLASTEGMASILLSDQAKTVRLQGESLTYTIYSTQEHVVENEMHALNLTVDTKSDVSAEYAKYHQPAVFNITFIKCPFGFSNAKTYGNKSLFSCQCGNRGVRTCSINNQTVLKHEQSWVGMFAVGNKTYLATAERCPFDYCDPTVKSVKSSQVTLNKMTSVGTIELGFSVARVKKDGA